MISPRHLKLLAVAAALAAAAAAIALKASAAHKPTLAPMAQPAQPALTVTTVRPQTAVLPARIRANGSVAAWQEASIGSEATGLRLVSVLVNVGDVVRRGQVLARFAPETVQANLAQLNAALAEAEASAADAAANAERARSLAPSGALSQQQVNHYLTAEQTARARVQAQRAAVQLQTLHLAQTQDRRRSRAWTARATSRSTSNWAHAISAGSTTRRCSCRLSGTCRPR